MGLVVGETMKSLCAEKLMQGGGHTGAMRRFH